MAIKSGLKPKEVSTGKTDRKQRVIPETKTKHKKGESPVWHSLC